jgi:hypothetical protein
MSGFLPILVICIAAGLIFAVIAFFTARYASTALSVSGDPTKIEINKYVTISTGNAVVALFLLSLIMTAGVPAYWLYLNGTRVDAPIPFEAAHIDPVVPALTIASRDFGSSAVLKVPLFRSTQTQHFTITPTREFDAFNLDAYYDWTGNRFMVSLDGKDEIAVPVESGYARMRNVITLRKARITGESVAKHTNVSVAKGRTQSAVLQPDPPGVPKS